MRETYFILLAMLITWPAIYYAISAAGFDIKTWELVLTALIGGAFAGLLVLLGETVIENLILAIALLVLAGILWGTTPRLGFIFISALLSGLVGVTINQIHQYAANKSIKRDIQGFGGSDQSKLRNKKDSDTS